MTKAERDALRAIAERETFTTFATELKISELANAVPKLLDALDAAEAEIERLKKYQGHAKECLCATCAP